MNGWRRTRALGIWVCETVFGMNHRQTGDYLKTGVLFLADNSFDIRKEL